MARKAKQIPTGSPVEENRQPAHAEVIASALAGAPSGEGPGEADTHEKVASEAGAVASAPELLSTDDPRAPQTDGGDGDPAGPVGGTDDAEIDAQLGEFLAGFPLLLAAARAFRAANPDRSVTGVRIAARRDGFRRAGMAHSKAPTDHPAARFSPEQLEALLSEPMLTVELV